MKHEPDKMERGEATRRGRPRRGRAGEGWGSRRYFHSRDIGSIWRGPDVVIGVPRLLYLFASALVEHSRSARCGWGRRGWQTAGSGPCEATAGAGATRFLSTEITSTLRA